MNCFNYATAAFFIVLSAHGAQANNLDTGWVGVMYDSPAYQDVMTAAVRWTPYDGETATNWDLVKPKVIGSWAAGDKAYPWQGITSLYGEFQNINTRTNFLEGSEQIWAKPKRSDPADAGDLLISVVGKGFGAYESQWDAPSSVGTLNYWGSVNLARTDPADAGTLLQPYVLAAAKVGM